MFLDVPTITFVGGFVSFASGLLLLLYWAQDRTAWSAFWWGVANAGAGFGILLLALQGLVPAFVSFVVGPSILDTCAALMWVAARVFNRSSVSPYKVIAGVMIWLAMAAVAGAAGEQYSVALGSGISGFVYMAAAIEFWRGRAEYLHGRWPMISILCLFAISLLLASMGFLTATRHAPVPPIGWFGVIHFASIINAIGTATILTAMLKERSEQKHKRDSLIDPLTGLANRRAFTERAQRIFDRAARDGNLVSLLAFDLDKFKQVNDTLGHAVGDRVLRIFADCLTRVLRPSDIAARMGGEEFEVVLSGCSSEAALAIAGRIRAAFQEDARFVDGQRVGATVSAGVATVAGHGCSLTDTLETADGALYRAKNQGRNRVVLAGSVSEGPASPNVIRIA